MKSCKNHIKIIITYDPGPRVRRHRPPPQWVGGTTEVLTEMATHPKRGPAQEHHRAGARATTITGGGEGFPSKVGGGTLSFSCDFRLFLRCFYIFLIWGRGKSDVFPEIPSTTDFFRCPFFFEY